MSENNKQPKETHQDKDDDKNNAQQKKGRIVIRNLVYDVNEKHLRGLLSKFGEILEVSMPLNPETNKSKGFAFIQFSNKNCALKAINELNGSKWKGRNIVLDLAVSKEDYKQVTGGDAAATTKKEDSSQLEIKDQKEKVINEEKNCDKKNEVNTEEDIESEEEEEEDEQQKKKTQKKLFENEDLSKTCFVRNLSFDISDKELREFCQTFGKVEMAKVCMNRETGNNKGTGFVKFKDPEVARKLLAKSDEYNSNYLKSKNGGNIHDIFSGVSELDLEMNGRRIIFLEAKKRDDVARFIDEKNDRNSINLDKVKSLEQLESFDRSQKRNIHLSKLGIFEEEPSMTQQEKEKRRSHLQEKINKLKNPNNRISATRIALKNLPKEEFQEEEIKLYAQEALIKEFGKDYIKKQNPIKQVLLLRDNNKVDKQEIPKSRGIGFIEFETPEQALSFLEFCVKDKLNFEKKHKKTPIIEFAIEDTRKMQKKYKVWEMVKQKQKAKKLDQKPKTKEEREQSKLILHNSNNAAKLSIMKILNDKDCSNMSVYEKGKSFLNDIQSRGLKQRLGKMLSKKFNVEQDNAPKTNDIEKTILDHEKKTTEKRTKEEKRKQLLKRKLQDEKIQKKIEQKNKKQEIENDLEVEASELIKAVSRELKKNKIKKMADEHDDLDDVVEQHLKKKIKKTKQESNQF